MKSNVTTGNRFHTLQNQEATGGNLMTDNVATKGTKMSHEGTGGAPSGGNNSTSHPDSSDIVPTVGNEQSNMSVTKNTASVLVGQQIVPLPKDDGQSQNAVITVRDTQQKAINRNGSTYTRRGGKSVQGQGGTINQPVPTSTLVQKVAKVYQKHFGDQMLIDQVS